MNIPANHSLLQITTIHIQLNSYYLLILLSHSAKHISLQQLYNRVFYFPGEDIEEIEYTIEEAKAITSVNRELITMYWEIGKIVSEKTASDGWGKSTVSALSSYLQSNIPSSTGFSERNIWRMKQFYETYKDKENCHHWWQKFHGRIIF